MIVIIHCAIIDGYINRLTQYMDAIKKSDMRPDSIMICYVGGDDNTHLFDELDAHIEYTQVSKNIQDYELPTLQFLYNYSLVNRGKNILYLHTKGIGKVINECIEDQVRYMVYFLVTQWKVCVDALRTYDTVGVDLRTEPVLHYSGNFWWSTTDHISNLPSPIQFKNNKNPLNSERHNQEFWICHKKSRHKSLWDCGINCYERHLHRYPTEQYSLKE